jgi:hypothetical protein
MSKADRGVAIRERPSPLHFMVRLTIDDKVALAHTFRWSEASADGSWVCPDLEVDDEIVRAWERSTCSFKEFCEAYAWRLTVTAYRDADGRIARLIPQSSIDLPSQYCDDEQYDDCATFVGYEEAVCDRLLVLGAQLTPARGARAADAEEVEEGENGFTFHHGLQLRLGYWPSLVHNDPDIRRTDWQNKFEDSSRDRSEFAALVHCLFDVSAV